MGELEWRFGGGPGSERALLGHLILDGKEKIPMNVYFKRLLK
jgi:hypothetical protein